MVPPAHPVVAMVMLCVPFGSHKLKYPAIGSLLSIKNIDREYSTAFGPLLHPAGSPLSLTVAGVARNMAQESEVEGP